MALGGTIRGKRTTLRMTVEDDLPHIARWMADLRVRHLARPWHEPAMPATWKERLVEQTKDKNSALWTIEADGACAGIVKVGFGWEPRRDTSHITSFFIDPDRWRQGLGFDAMLALHRYLFDYLDLRRVGAEHYADNVAAARIAARIGYVEFARGHEARYRDGAYVDLVWMYCERETWDERWPTEREYAPLGAVPGPEDG